MGRIDPPLWLKSAFCPLGISRMNKGNFIRVIYVSLLVLKEALVVTHSELCLKLSEGLKSNTYNDDKRSTTEGEYTGVLLSVCSDDCSVLSTCCSICIVATNDPLNNVLDYVRACDDRENSNNAEEQGTCEGDLVKNLLDVVRGRSSLSDTGNSRPSRNPAHY